MVKALTFKGDKKSKKRKRTTEPADADTPSKELATTSSAAATNEDDSWVTAELPSDVSGPVIFVLPTEPTTCLACDANGKVFTSEIENFVDNDPATAEPHDVRQVWVANRVAGTENFSFKGHHGRYIRRSDKLQTLHLIFDTLLQVSELRQIWHSFCHTLCHLSRRIISMHSGP